MRRGAPWPVFACRVRQAWLKASINRIASQSASKLRTSNSIPYIPPTRLILVTPSLVSRHQLDSHTVANMTSTIGIPIKLLNEAQGHIVTLEIDSGTTYRGKLIEGARQPAPTFPLPSFSSSSSECMRVSTERKRDSSGSSSLTHGGCQRKREQDSLRERTKMQKQEQ